MINEKLKAMIRIPMDSRGWIHYLCIAFILCPEITAAGILQGSSQEIWEETGFTELMFAARSGDVELVKREIEKGADVNTRAGWGVTSLVLAASQGHEEIVKELLSRGAQPNIPTSHGNTAIIHATIKNSVPIVRLLCKNGADPNVIPDRESYDSPAILIAAAHGNIDLLKEIISCGANIEIEDYISDRTALAVLVLKGSEEGVRLLLNRGANPHAAVKKSALDGRSALWHARKQGKKKVVDLIEDAIHKKIKKLGR